MVCRETIAYILEQLGVGRSYQGFDYTLESCVLVLEDPERLQAVTKQVYYVVAERMGTSWNCVERDIRTVARIIWKNEDSSLFQEFCGGTKREQPTASGLISMICTYVTRRNAQECYCLKTGQWCEEKAYLQRQIAKLSEERQR